MTDQHGTSIVVEKKRRPKQMPQSDITPKPFQLGSGTGRRHHRMFHRQHHLHTKGFQDHSSHYLDQCRASRILMGPFAADEWRSMSSLDIDTHPNRNRHTHLHLDRWDWKRHSKLLTSHGTAAIPQVWVRVELEAQVLVPVDLEVQASVRAELEQSRRRGRTAPPRLQQPSALSPAARW